jgi:hypothetical protein
MPFKNGDRYPQRRAIIDLSGRPMPLEMLFAVSSESLFPSNDELALDYLPDVPLDIDPDRQKCEISLLWCGDQRWPG